MSQDFSVKQNQWDIYKQFIITDRSSHTYFLVQNWQYGPGAEDPRESTVYLSLKDNLLGHQFPLVDRSRAP